MALKMITEEGKSEFLKLKQAGDQLKAAWSKLQLKASDSKM